MRTTRRQFVLGSLAATLPLSATRASADVYPERPITFICPWPVGGTADATMRALCAAAARELGRPVVVDNKAGASGMLGLRALASARPDGYTIGQIPISVTRFSQLGMVQLDPLKDLTYIARVSGQTFGIAVRSEAPWQTLADLVADAKANPARISYGTAGIGGATHVGMEEFAHAAGIRFNPIPFKGGADALQALMGGHVDVLADSSSWAPQVRAGRLRLLATWGAQRTAEFKDTPTLRESGYDVVVDAPNGVGAPHGLPAGVLARLRDVFKAAAASEEFAQACARIDAPLMYLDAPDYQRYIADTMKHEKVLIERLKLKELMGRT